VSRIADTNNSNGNGQNSESRIEKVYEPLDEERWVEQDTETNRREIASRDEVRRELDIEDDDDDESKSD
jgi:hypothetical protein